MNKNVDTLRQMIKDRLMARPRSTGQISQESGVDRQVLSRFLMRDASINLENWLKLEKYLIMLEKEADEGAKESA